MYYRGCINKDVAEGDSSGPPRAPGSGSPCRDINKSIYSFISSTVNPIFNAVIIIVNHPIIFSLGYGYTKIMLN